MGLGLGAESRGWVGANGDYETPFKNEPALASGIFLRVGPYYRGGVSGLARVIYRERGRGGCLIAVFVATISQDDPEMIPR